ncbi:MAG TPA: serine hydrolase domain-containing protein [Chloroflexaceae bacterium]|nr:serine hydrolase domain-containing protein [Chloroflexaceae bacterium]
MRRNTVATAPAPGRLRSALSVALAALLLCLGALPPASRAAPAERAARALDPALVASLERALAGVSRNQSVPGVAVAVSVPGYQTWHGTRGLADRRQGAPVEPAHRFRIGSLSKLFVATVAMQLVEEGTLDLNAPIGMWMPGVVPAADRMSLRQVMNHTSGLNDYLDNPFMRRVLQNPRRVWAPTELVAVAVERGPYFQPGARGRWRYSNTDYVLLGMLIEKVTGNSLAEEVHQRVIDRLGLRNTFVVPDDRVTGPLMRGYAGNGDWTDLHPSFAWGAGNIVSTVDDLTVFGQALFEGRLMSRRSLASMLTFVDAGSSFGLRGLEYGLGVMRYRMPVGRGHSASATLALGHIGGIGGYRAALWYLPESKITIVAGFNEANVDPAPLPNEVLRAILDHQGR